MKWCAADTDLGFTRDRRPYARKSGKPDLRGPFQSVAVPDQQRTASLRSRCIASGTHDTDRSIRHSIPTIQTALLVPAAHFCVNALSPQHALAVRSLYFPVFLQIRIFHPRSYDLKQHALPPSRGAFLRPGFCIVASLTPNEGWAERRETFGCSGTRAARHNAACQEPSEAPCAP